MRQTLLFAVFILLFSSAGARLATGRRRLDVAEHHGHTAQDVAALLNKDESSKEGLAQRSRIARRFLNKGGAKANVSENVLETNVTMTEAPEVEEVDGETAPTDSATVASDGEILNTTGASKPTSAGVFDEEGQRVTGPHLYDDKRQDAQDQASAEHAEAEAEAEAAAEAEAEAEAGNKKQQNVTFTTSTTTLCKDCNTDLERDEVGDSHLPGTQGQEEEPQHHQPPKRTPPIGSIGSNTQLNQDTLVHDMVTPFFLVASILFILALLYSVAFLCIMRFGTFQPEYNARYVRGRIYFCVGSPCWYRIWCCCYNSRRRLLCCFRNRNDNENRRPADAVPLGCYIPICWCVRVHPPVLNILTSDGTVAGAGGSGDGAAFARALEGGGLSREERREALLEVLSPFCHTVAPLTTGMEQKEEELTQTVPPGSFTKCTEGSSSCLYCGGEISEEMAQSLGLHHQHQLALQSHKDVDVEAANGVKDDKVEELEFTSEDAISNAHIMAMSDRSGLMLDYKGENDDAYSTEEPVCSICLCEYEDGETYVISSKCPHRFHRDCIVEWLEVHNNTACPNCRINMITNEQVREASKKLRRERRRRAAAAAAAAGGDMNGLDADGNVVGLSGGIVGQLRRRLRAHRKNLGRMLGRERAPMQDGRQRQSSDAVPTVGTDEEGQASSGGDAQPVVDEAAIVGQLNETSNASSGIEATSPPSGVVTSESDAQVAPLPAVAETPSEDTPMDDAESAVALENQTTQQQLDPEAPAADGGRNAESPESSQTLPPTSEVPPAEIASSDVNSGAVEMTDMSTPTADRDHPSLSNIGVADVRSPVGDLTPNDDRPPDLAMVSADV